jgi:acyl carrier protein
VYSLGEFAGLVIAGVLNLRDALIFVATRERLILEKCVIKSSGMVAVSLEPVKLQSLLESQQEFSDLSIACYNSPTDCVVSGPLPQLKTFKTHLDIEAIINSRLLVAYGYHSPAMVPVIQDLRVLSGKIKTQAPSLPVISTVLGRVVMPGDLSSFTNDYFVRHCAEPVRFTQGIYSYVSNANLVFDGTIWMELGPHPRILPMLQKFPDLSDSVFLGSLRRGQDSWSAMSVTLCNLYLTNQLLDWRRVFGQLGSTSCVSLPSYPFSKKRFWVPFREETAPSMAGTRVKDSMNHDWVQMPSTDNGNIAIFKIPMTRIERYMTGHCVAGLPLCPASVFLELVVAGVILTTKHLARYYDDLHVALQQIHFTKALTTTVTNEGNIMIKVVIDAETGTFSIGSGLSQSKCQIIHTHGEYRLQSASELATKLARNPTSIPQVFPEPEKAHGSESFSARTVYEIIFPRVVKYSKDFQTIQFLDINSDGMGATATVALGLVSDRSSFVIDPVFLDTLLHVVGFISNLRGNLHEAYICDEIGLVELIPSVIKSGATFVIHCNISWNSEQNAMLGESYAISDAYPRTVVAHMKGIRFRRVRLSSLKAGLANSLEVASSSLEPTLPALSRDVQSPEQQVFQIITRTCKIDAKNITLTSDLDGLGINSLMRLELSFELAKAFPTIGDIQRNILKFNNVLDIVKMISADNGIDEESCYTPPSATSSSSTLVLDDWDIVTGKSPLKRIFADILEIEQSVISDSQDLTYLGLDSLAAMEAIYRIKKEYNLHLSASFFELNRTIHDIHASIQHTLKSSPIDDKLNTRLVIEHGSTVKGRLPDILNPDHKMVLLQQSSGNKMPLVLIHDGSGLAISYRCITALNRDVWGINNPRFANLDSPWESVIEMAESYAEYILEMLESGPLLLGG